MEYKWIENTEAGFEDARLVRRAVFVQEQGYSEIGEFDEQDENSYHIIGYSQGKPVCTARLFCEEAGIWHIGRVAVLMSERGKGAGFALLTEIVSKAKQLKAQKLVLGAQADKTAFYEKAGFTETDIRFLDEGQPHVKMERILV